MNKKNLIIKNVKNYFGFEICVALMILLSTYAVRGDFKKTFCINFVFTVIIIINLLFGNKYDEAKNIIYWKSGISFLLLAAQIDIQCIILMNLSFYNKILLCGTLYITSIFFGIIYFIRKVHNKITKLEKILGYVFGSILLVVGYFQKHAGKVLTGRIIQSIKPLNNSKIGIWIFYLILVGILAFTGGGMLIADIYVLSKKGKN